MVHQTAQRRPLRALPPAAARAVVAVLALLGLLHVLALQGHLPGLGPPAIMTLLAVGDAQCLVRDGGPVWGTWCSAVGLPEGRASFTGIPQVQAAWLLSLLPGLDVWLATRVVAVLVDLVGFAGVLGLARRWSLPPAAAVLAAVLYLGSGSVVFLADAYFTVTGFVLLPAAALAFLLAGDAAARGGRAGPAAVVATVPAVMAFTDGYAFMGCMLLTGVLGVARAVARERRAVPLLAAWLVSAAASALAWQASVPDGSEDLSQGLGAFRYLGADVLTFVLPTRELWWSSSWGWELDRLWGDGSNVVGGYLGAVMVAASAWAVVVLWRGPSPARHLAGGAGEGGATAAAGSAVRRWELVALVVVALAALVLSLGPALKVAEEAVPLPVVWDVPVRYTDGRLPTELLYAHVPGFSSMRATHRWVGVTVLVLSLLTAAAVGLAARRGRPVLALVLACAALAETTLDLPAEWAERRASAEHVAVVREELVPELATLVRPGERVLMLPASNDFLVNTLMPFTGAGSYNAGIDRSAGAARAGWPSQVRRAVAASGRPATASEVCLALREDVDVVVLPRLSLMQQGVRWPPSDAVVGDAETRAAVLLADPRLAGTTDRWFWTFRPAPARNACTDRAPARSSALSSARS